MAKENSAGANPPKVEADPKLKPLENLVGEWEAEAINPLDATKTAKGTVIFEFLEGGAWLVEHSGNEAPFPSSISIIGYDDTTGNFTQHYFDSRGVSRVYEMRMLDNTLKIWRDDPDDFSQRFTGDFSDDGNTITGHWEKAIDGQNYEHDFDLTFRRKK